METAASNGHIIKISVRFSEASVSVSETTKHSLDEQASHSSLSQHVKYTDISESYRVILTFAQSHWKHRLTSSSSSPAASVKTRQHKRSETLTQTTQLSVE